MSYSLSLHSSKASQASLCDVVMCNKLQLAFFGIVKLFLGIVINFTDHKQRFGISGQYAQSLATLEKDHLSSSLMKIFDGVFQSKILRLFGILLAQGQTLITLASEAFKLEKG